MRMFFLLFIYLLITSCSPIQNKIVNDGELVEQPGLYQFRNDNAHILKIYIENDLVRYTLQDSVGNELLRYKDNISAFQKWTFYIDEKKSLWVFSSDIGNSVWTEDSSDKKYNQTYFYHPEDIAKVPREISKKVEQHF